MYLEYPSSQDSGLRLFGHFAVPDRPGRILVQFARERFARKIVAPDLKTHQFEIVLDSIDHLATLEYNLEQEKFLVRAPSAQRADVCVRGKGIPVAVEQCECLP